MKKIIAILVVFMFPIRSMASEADLVIPDAIKDQRILYWGFLITLAGLLFGFYQFVQVKKIKAHQSMLDVAQVIFETSKTYLIQQGKFIFILFPIIILWGFELAYIILGGRGPSDFLSITWIFIFILIYFFSFKAFRNPNLFQYGSQNIQNEIGLRKKTNCMIENRRLTETFICSWQNKAGQQQACIPNSEKQILIQEMQKLLRYQQESLKNKLEYSIKVQVKCFLIG